MKKVLSIDLGGTKVAAAVVSARGELLKTITFPTLAQQMGSGAALANQLCNGLKPLLKEFEFGNALAVGLASAGPCDVQTGSLQSPTHFPKLRGTIPLTQLIQKKLELEFKKVEIRFQNDAMAAALGEQWVGKTQHVQSSAMITVGTGLGTGCIFNRRPLQSRGLGGEAGHQLFHFSNKRPSSFEQLASGTALQKKLLNMGLQSFAELKKLSTEQRTNLFQPLAISLAELCRNLSLMYAPESLVFTGSVMGSRRYFWQALKAHYAQRMKTHPQLKGHLTVSQLKNPALYGAASLFFAQK